MKRIGVVGAGAWGVALVLAIHRASQLVTLWIHEATTASKLTSLRESPYLHGVYLPTQNISLTTNPEILTSADVILLAIPAQYFRYTCMQLAPYWKQGVPAIICTKGIEYSTCALMHEIVNEALPKAVVAVLSGPSFAQEVANGLPTALTLACPDPVLGRILVKSLSTQSFRLYLSNDILGAEIGGAVKNVLAIGCGIVKGRGLGDNASASLTARGIAEIIRLTVAEGGNAETVMGLCGLGDLILTANSVQSRNFSFGLALGSGTTVVEVLNNYSALIEGFYTASAVTKRAKTLAVDMPICQAVNSILHLGEHIDEAIHSLLNRPFRGEQVFK